MGGVKMTKKMRVVSIKLIRRDQVIFLKYYTHSLTAEEKKELKLE